MSRVFMLVTAFACLSTVHPLYASEGGGSKPNTPSIGMAGLVELRPQLYMITVNGCNIALQFGDDGAIVVDPGPPNTADAVLQAIRSVTDKPIRYIVDTSADPDNVGNNAQIAAAGLQLGAGFVNRGVASALGFGGGQAATITAYQAVINRMISTPPPGVSYAGTALPGDFYDTPHHNFYLNGGQVNLIWEPAAHSDGDSVVVFRRDDVIVTGAIFDMTRFPVIDLAAGGSIQGEVDSINRLLDTQVTPVTPLMWREGAEFGTLVIPARGHVSEQGDLVQYRDMLTIIRDRVAYYLKQGKSEQQVVALRPAAGYAPRFDAPDGAWTTDMFVAAVYKSLQSRHGKAKQVAAELQ